MRKLLFTVSLGAVLCAGTLAAFSQATEDEVAKAQKEYPLAAPAGVDSHALEKAPPGAVNQGPYDMTKWKYGHAWDAPRAPRSGIRSS